MLVKDYNSITGLVLSDTETPPDKERADQETKLDDVSSISNNIKVKDELFKKHGVQMAKMGGNVDSRKMMLNQAPTEVYGTMTPDDSKRMTIEDTYNDSDLISFQTRIVDKNDRMNV